MPTEGIPIEEVPTSPTGCLSWLAAVKKAGTTRIVLKGYKTTKGGSGLGTDKCQRKAYL